MIAIWVITVSLFPEVGQMRQQNGKATIRDVARLAGVSVSSVSRYLADPGSVRAYSAYRIRDAIRQLRKRLPRQRRQPMRLRQKP